MLAPWNARVVWDDTGGWVRRHPPPGRDHLMAIGLIGEPTARVNGSGGAQKKNS